jgi:CheY-like chemotaxis protein
MPCSTCEPRAGDATVAAQIERNVTIPRLIAIGGHPYCRKEQLGHALARGMPCATHVRYAHPLREGTAIDPHARFLQQVHRAFEDHPNVIASGPLSRAEHRAALLAIAERRGARFVYVECTASREAIAHTIATQFASAAPDFLELRCARALGQREGYQPASDELPRASLIRLECGGPLAETLAALRSALALPPEAALDSSEASPAAAEAAGPTRTPRVLVVDDDRDLCSTLREVLEVTGCAVSVATSGAQAIALAETGADPPDVVLLDYSMPDWNGLDLADPLRQRWPHAWIVLLTAYDEPWICDEAFRAEIDEYLRKPVSASDLFQLVERALQA